MRLAVFSNERVLARSLARRIAGQLARNPRLVLGLPTGRTPLPLYRELVALHRRGQTDYSAATSFNLDEFVNLEADDPRSYRSYMHQHLFRHINISPRRTHFLDGMAPDLERECERFEQAILRAGGIDLQILGIGGNGHIGFNEPAPELSPWSHRARLTIASRRANAAFFEGSVRKVPREALSMGVATILHAQSIVLIATGSSKSDIVERMVMGPVASRLPASLLQLHHDVEVLLDDAAAAALRERGVLPRAGRTRRFHEPGRRSRLMAHGTRLEAHGTRFRAHGRKA